MNSLKVALLQLLPENTIEENMKKGLEYCKKAKDMGARAYENMVGIATVNYPAGQPDCNGHSTAFDGIAYRPSEPGSRDTLIIEAGEREGIYIADFPVNEIREYRRREVHGNAYRRPRKYKLLVSEHVEEPFIRKDARR